jgi:hypothetical protein
MTIHVPRSECSGAERALIVYDRDTVLKRLPLRGLRGEILAFDRYVAISTPAASWPSLVGWAKSYKSSPRRAAHDEQ